MTRPLKIINDDLNKWVKHKSKMCKTCRSNCCFLPVEVDFNDLLNMGLVQEIEQEEFFLKQVILRLTNKGIVKRYNFSSKKFLLKQNHDNRCQFLDHDQKCTVYNKRPQTCRDFPRNEFFKGRCPYDKKDEDKRSS